MIKREITELFNTYLKNYQLQEIVALLTNYLIDDDLTDEDKCWALWNISDSLARLRNSDGELLNHKKFEKQLSYMDPKYLHCYK